MRVPNGVLAAKCSDRWIGLRSPVTSAKPTTSEESMVFLSVSVMPTGRPSKSSICSGNILRACELLDQRLGLGSVLHFLFHAHRLVQWFSALSAIILSDTIPAMLLIRFAISIFAL